VLFVKSTMSVHRISPRVRDDRDTPLTGTRRRGYKTDLGQARTDLFSAKHWTAGIERVTWFARQAVRHGCLSPAMTKKWTLATTEAHSRWACFLHSSSCPGEATKRSFAPMSRHPRPTSVAPRTWITGTSPVMTTSGCPRQAGTSSAKTRFALFPGHDDENALDSKLSRTKAADTFDTNTKLASH